MIPPPIVDKATAEAAQPRSMILGMWITLAALSLLFSPQVSVWILHDGWLSNQTWALATARGLESVSQWTRIRRAHDRIDELVSGAEKRRDSRLIGEDAGRGRQVDRGASARRVPVGEAESLFDERGAVHRILLIGESSIQFYMGSELELMLRATYRDLEIKRFGKLATSLVRNDVLDWREKTKDLVDEFQPDLVIANFGGNDAQNMVLETGAIVKFGTARWDVEYALKVSALAGVVRERGARLAMIGMPAMRDPSFSKRMKHLNEIVRQQMDRVGETFLSSWDLSVDADGEYRKAITVDGKAGLMRLSDGKHYSKIGARFVAEKTAERLEQHFLLVPRDRDLSVVVRRDMTSHALKQRASYLAYVPQQAASGRVRLPVLFLLHGTGGNLADWSEHAHRKLQRLSSSHQLIVVTPEGGANGWYIDSPLVPGSQYESHLINEVIAEVDRSLPTSGVRAIAGLSAGGHGAISLALKHPGLFRSASSMSGALDLTQATDRPALIERLGPYSAAKRLWEKNSARHLLAERPDVARRIPMLISIGSSDRWLAANRAFVEDLKALGVEHVYQEHEGQHDWSYWTQHLAAHVSWHARKLGAVFEPSPGP